MKLKPNLTLTPKQKTILKYASVPLFYFFALVVFVRVTFPYETLRNRILAEFNSSQGDKRLEIDEMSGSGLFGVEVEGVRLSEVVVNRPEGESGPPKLLALESASVSIGALSYLFGTISVDFDAVVGGGELFGDFKQNAEEAHINVEGEGIDISGLTLLSAGIGLPLGGNLSGAVALFLPGGQMRKAEGSFDLLIQEFTAGDGKAKVRNTIALPKISAGDLVLKAEAADGRLEVKELSAAGKDFELQASGKLRMREPFDKSSVNMDASFKFKEPYTQKNDMTKGIFGATGSKVPALFDMDPMVKRAKQPDGSYSWQVTGLLSQPSFRPGRAPKAAVPDNEE